MKEDILLPRGRDDWSDNSGTRVVVRSVGFVLAILVSVFAFTGVGAREVGADNVPYSPQLSQTPSPPDMTGTVATSSVGRVGERQSADRIVGVAKPMTRIQSRISSRLATRLQTRLDRNSNANVSTASALATADSDVRSAARVKSR
jgi:hypothetical protein